MPTLHNLYTLRNLYTPKLCACYLLMPTLRNQQTPDLCAIVCAGIVGTKYLLPVLSQYGHHDVAMALASQTTFPSWGYMVEQTATTLWESWEGTQYKAVSSRNHIMFGGQSSWYYQYIAGLQVGPYSKAWEHILIAPQITPAIRKLLNTPADSLCVHACMHACVHDVIWAFHTCFMDIG